MTTSLGAKIKRHRKEKGYSLDKLAALTDSSKSYLWELENRDTRKPSGEKLTRIAQALEVTTDYLLDDSEEPGDEVLKEAFFRKFCYSLCIYSFCFRFFGFRRLCIHSTSIFNISRLLYLSFLSLKFLSCSCNPFNFFWGQIQRRVG